MDASTLTIGLIADPLQWAGWLRAKDMLVPALELHAEWPQIEAQLADGTAHLGIVSEGGDQDLLAAMVLRTVATRSGQMIEVLLIGGRDHQRWIAPLSAMLEHGARQAGCVGLRAWGRPGWTPALSRLGWRSDVRCYEKKVA